MQNFDIYNNLSVVNVVVLAVKSYISQVKRSVEMIACLSKNKIFNHTIAFFSGKLKKNRCHKITYLL